MDKKSFKKKPGGPNGRKNAKNVIFIALVVLFGLIIFAANGQPKDLEEVNLSEVIQRANNGEISKLTITGEEVKVTKQGEDEPSQVAIKGSDANIYELGLQQDEDSPVIAYNKDTSGNSTWVDIGVSLLPVVIISFVLFFMLRSAQGQGSQAMSFGKSKARLYGNEKKKVVFKDIAGNDESKQDLEEVVEFLKYPKKFESVGAKIPKGVMLVGPPGTGKTMLARAVAGEANVPFFSISGSEFVEMFVGVGASRVRDLFAKAKKNAPCIIFIDEIDAVGRRRGSGMGGGHDEREQTLNQILTEMDGFEQGANVIVLAATNRADVLDPALLRPGRFDRRVNITLPDRKAREQILKLHFKEKPLDSKVDVDALAAKTAGSSGADLANIANEAAIVAARNNKKTIDNSDVTEAFERVAIGPERKSKIMSEHEKELTAYHEASGMDHVTPPVPPRGMIVTL